MLSICIPIYNVDVSELVSELTEQSKKLNVLVEIVCIDDCSTNSIRLQNRVICNLKTKYIELAANIGRARIRNLFLHYTTFDYLLFLDCDVKIHSPKFIETYIAAIEANTHNVICGGHVYQNEKPDKDKLLKWEYATKKECRTVAVRNTNASISFMSANFVVSKNVFSGIQFDERLLGYGHEDTLFGFELSQAKVGIQHIENAVFIADLDTTILFIEKTERAIDNLIYILKLKDNSVALMNYVTLLRFYMKCKKYYLIPFIRFSFFVFGEIIKNKLSRGVVNLKLFDFYKLGYLVSRIEK